MNLSIYKNQNLGFTLMETLLTMVLISSLFSFFIPIAISFVKKNDLDMAAEISANALFRAQSLAKLSSHDSSWGVKFESQRAVLYAGDSFLTRNLDLDEIFPFATSIDYAGATEVWFEKFSGLPPSATSITLSNSPDQTSSIFINKFGVVIR